MSTQISRLSDLTDVGVDFETGTMCGNSKVARRNGTAKCFTILPWNSEMVVMPKFQALTIASQIADQFGYRLEKKR